MAAAARHLLALADRYLPPIASVASNVRLRLLAKFEEQAPKPIFHLVIAPQLTHILAPTVAIFVISVVLGTTRNLNLFSFHPIFMSFGAITFMSEALLVYRNGALTSMFAEIMAGTSKEKARAIHMTLQIAGCCFMILGYVFILANKALHGKTIFPLSIHAWLGTLAMALMAMQILIGSMKIQSTSPVYRWHGSAGKVTYDITMLAVVTGALSFFPVSLLSPSSYTFNLFCTNLISRDGGWRYGPIR